MLGYSKITVSSTAVGLGTLPADTARAVIACEGADVRFRADGEDPTTTDGMPLLAGQEVELDSGIAEFLAIRSGSSDATFHVAFYRKA